MVCENCGAALTANERFCRSCGAAAQPSAQQQDLPTAEDAWTTPVGGGGPQRQRAQGGGRPGWLVPVLIAGGVLGLVVVVALGGLLVLNSGGSDPAPLTEQAAPVLAPVTADLESLSGKLDSARSKPALAKAKVSALRLAEEASSAAATVRAFDLPKADETAERLLAASLDATNDYATRVAEAASDPRQAAVDEVGTSAAAAKSSFAALAAAVPGLQLPPASSFTVVAFSHAPGRSGKDRVYVTKIDRALTRSARTRGSLGDLIEGVSKKTIPADEQAAEAAGIVDQRNQLKTVVQGIEAPPAFKRSSALLIASLDAAIADDVAIQDWVLAGASGDPAGADAAWKKHLAATAKATAAKQAFVREYDAARKQALGLAALAVGDKY